MRSWWCLLFLCLLLKVEGKVKGEEDAEAADDDGEVSGDSDGGSTEDSGKKGSIPQSVVFGKYDATDTGQFIEAFSGYDVLMGDPFMNPEGVTSRDPGSKSRMFEYNCPGPMGASYCKGIDVYNVYSCMQKYNTKVIRTVDQFEKKVGSSSSTGFSIGYENNFKVEAEIPEVPVTVSKEVKMEVGAEFSNSETKQKLTQFFKEKKGSVTVNSARCRFMQVDLESLPLLTDGFTDKLKAMAKLKPDSAAAKKAFLRFVKKYGTHYRQTCTFGAEYLETSFYNEDSRRDFDEDTVSACSNKGFGMNVGGVNAKYENKKCSNEDETKLKSNFDAAYNKIIASRGSDPPGSDGWFSQTFHPVPVGMTLEPLTNVMSKSNLFKNGFSSATEVKKLQQVFFPLYDRMCGLRGIKCHEKVGGCGIDDNCGFNQNCVDKGQGKYECKDMDRVMNFARGRPAKQSSTKDKNYPGNAVDGDLTNQAVSGAVSGDLTWWNVDLECKIIPSEIRLFLVESAFKSGYYRDLRVYTSENIYEGDDLCRKYSNADSDKIKTNQPMIVKCNKDLNNEGKTRARLVVVTLGGLDSKRNAPLYLKEVMVMALSGSESPVNFALKAKAWSENGYFGESQKPSLAVDGDSATHASTKEGNPAASLVIDMGKTIKIDYINVYFYIYGVKKGYNKDLTLFTKDPNRGAFNECAKWEGKRTKADWSRMSPWRTSCKWDKFSKGRWVKLSTYSKEPLYVDELEVYGFVYNKIDQKKDQIEAPKDQVKSA